MSRAPGIPYRAPWWLPGGHAQTIYAVALARRPKGRLRVDRWDTPDGDVVRVDRLEGDRAAPLVVFFHGLEGSAESHYVRSLAVELQALGWRLLVPHWRGCGGVASVKPRAYHSGDAAEGRWMLERAAELADGAPLFAAGVSLGGSVLLNFLGHFPAEAARCVQAAVAVSAPVDLAAGGDVLERGFNRFYTKVFLSTMKPAALAKLAQFPGLFDETRLRAARTLRAFDDVFTAPLHGYEGVDDFWSRASSKPLLRNILVPTLLLNARNDPFLPDQHLPQADEVSAAVTVEFPSEGGHVGFVSGPFPGHLRWLPLRLIEHFNQALRPTPNQ